MKELIIKHRSKKVDDYNGYYCSFKDFDVNAGIDPYDALESDSALGNRIYGPYKSKQQAVKSMYDMFD